MRDVTVNKDYIWDFKTLTILRQFIHLNSRERKKILNNRKNDFDNQQISGYTTFNMICSLFQLIFPLLATIEQTKSQTNRFLIKNIEGSSPFYMHIFRYFCAVNKQLSNLRRQHLQLNTKKFSTQRIVHKPQWHSLSSSEGHVCGLLWSIDTSKNNHLK